jgi:hypothetical protein
MKPTDEGWLSERERKKVKKRERAGCRAIGSPSHGTDWLAVEAGQLSVIGKERERARQEGLQGKNYTKRETKEEIQYQNHKPAPSTHGSGFPAGCSGCLLRPRSTDLLPA